MECEKSHHNFLFRVGVCFSAIPIFSVIIILKFYTFTFGMTSYLCMYNIVRPCVLWNPKQNKYVAHIKIRESSYLYYMVCVLYLYKKGMHIIRRLLWRYHWQLLTPVMVLVDQTPCVLLNWSWLLVVARWYDRVKNELPGRCLGLTWSLKKQSSCRECDTTYKISALNVLSLPRSL